MEGRASRRGHWLTIGLVDCVTHRTAKGVKLTSSQIVSNVRPAAGKLDRSVLFYHRW